MSRRGEFHFGAKLVAVVLLAGVAGFVWAMIETGRSPSDILKFFGSKEAPPDGPKSELPKESARTPDKKDPPKETPKGAPPPVPPPPAPRGYNAAEMEALFRDVDDKLKQGRIKEAREKISGFNRLLVPAEHTERFRTTEARADACYRLLLETSPGAAVPMPEMAELVTQNGTRGILVKNLRESGDEWSYETLTGIHGRLPKAQVRELTKLTETGRRAAAVDYELERMCQSRGVSVTRAPGGWTF